jgi:hypothetical protein
MDAMDAGGRGIGARMHMRGKVRSRSGAIEMMVEQVELVES